MNPAFSGSAAMRIISSPGHRFLGILCTIPAPSGTQAVPRFAEHSAIDSARPRKGRNLSDLLVRNAESCAWIPRTRLYPKAFTPGSTLLDALPTLIAARNDDAAPMYAYQRYDTLGEVRTSRRDGTSCDTRHVYSWYASLPRTRRF